MCLAEQYYRGLSAFEKLQALSFVIGPAPHAIGAEILAAHQVEPGDMIVVPGDNIGYEAVATLECIETGAVTLILEAFQLTVPGRAWLCVRKKNS